MKTYMLCNAHLDPIWLWQWESGLSETLSTFRQASAFIDEYPDFVFNHNEAMLYQWIEEHDPALFKRIRRQVKEGRWKIIGGWYLQPDVNMPCGEAIVRQILTGRRYFYEKFGRIPETAVNFDSFGHARGLVQVLRQCGYKYYLNIRPGKWEYDFPEENFIWQGYDGSEVIAHRSDKGYNSVFGKVGEELPGWMEDYKDLETGLYCWGVGNHGGGPSRIDLEAVAALKDSGANLVHSTPDEYFKTVRREDLRVLARGLNPVSEGCYTSIIRIKQQHRRLENDLLMVETMASHAQAAGLAKYKKKKIDEAWRDLFFAEFHDSLPGSCIRKAEEDVLRQLDHGLEIANKLKAKYFIALTAGQKKLTDGDTVPLFVYNPHPYPVKMPVDAEFLLPRQLWHDKFSNPVVYCGGERLPSQSAKESGNFNMDWCKRVVFEAELPACAMARFDVRFEVMDRRPAPVERRDGGLIIVKTDKGVVKVNTQTGCVDSWTVDGKEYARPGAFRADVYADSYNSWDGKGVHDPKTPKDCFRPMTAAEATAFTGVKGGEVLPVRVTDDGEVNTVVEADLRYHLSRMVQRYIINKRTGMIEVESAVFFAENEKRLKLHVPTTVEDGTWTGQTMFGREALSNSRRDAVSQYWQALSNGQSAVAVIDDGLYGSYSMDGSMEITMLRSAGYGASSFTWGEPYHDPMYQPRMEQGERRCRFKVIAGAADEVLSGIDREAAVFNRMPYALAYCPSGEGKEPLPLIEIGDPAISMSCFKRSEKKKDRYVLRLFDAQGRGGHTPVTLPAFGVKAEFDFKPFEIRTFFVSDGGIEPVNMLENTVPVSEK